MVKKIIINIFWRYRYKIIFFCCILVINAFLLFPIPLITKHIIDVSIPEQNSRQVLTLSFTMLAVFLFQKFLSFLQAKFFFKLNKIAEIKLKIHLLDKMFRISDIIRRKKSASYFSSRIISDAENLEPLFPNRLAGIIQDMGYCIVGVCGMFIFNKTLAIIVLPFLFLYAYFIKHFKSKIRQCSYENSEVYASAYSVTEECIRSARTISIFKKKYFALIRFLKSQHNLYNVGNKFFRINYVYNLWISIISYLPYITTLALGSIFIINSKMTIGTLIAYQSFINYTFGPISSLMSFYGSAQTALSSAERIKEVLLLEEKANDACKENKTDFEKLSIESLSFKYDEKVILSNVAFSLSRNEKIAIIGPSGSGKTTIAHILSDLLPPNNINYIVDDVLLAKNSSFPLRNKIVLSEQDNFLFDATVIENIYLKSNIIKSEEDAIFKNIINHLCLQDIANKENVGNNGVELSSGQKQRVCLARCLINNPDILILDESLANIEEELEEKILDYLFTLNICIILITHRTKNLYKFDKIIEINNGKIINSKVSYA